MSHAFCLLRWRWQPVLLTCLLTLHLTCVNTTPDVTNYMCFYFENLKPEVSCYVMLHLPVIYAAVASLFGIHCTRLHYSA